MKKLSVRGWISIVTVVLVGIVLFVARKDIHHAWLLLERVDGWILVAMIPTILAGYAATGEMVFSYLRQKGYAGNIGLITQMRISMELNFVNHILPSGGVSGVSYMNWRLKKLGVPLGRATMAQVVRYVAGFAALVSLLAVSVLMVTIDGHVNRWIILMSSVLVAMMVLATFGGMFLLSSPARIQRVGKWIERVGNTLVRRLTFGRVGPLINATMITNFLDDMHDDYLTLMHDKRVLIRPFLWGLFFMVTEAAIFWIVFWALGSPVNPAPILIAYGLASLMAVVVATPGGAGAYEAAMVLVLTISGMKSGEAIAGVILTRVVALFVTIVVGYVFYQQALLKHGKQPE